MKSGVGMYKPILLAIFALLFFCVSASADTINDSLLWRLRITSIDAIAKNKIAGQFVMWCAEENKKTNPNPYPCERYVETAQEAEEGILKGRKVLELTIKELQKAPQSESNKYHMNTLRDMLDEMIELPTPLHDMLSDSQ